MPQISVILACIQTISALFSAFLVPLIALVTALIFYFQYRLERQRWRLALYDKRYPVFTATMEYLGNIVGKKNITDEEMRKFLTNSKGKEFLFDEDVQQFLKELYDKGSTLRIVVKNEEFAGDKEEHRKIVEKEVEWFLNQFNVAITLFKKYLAIGKK